MIQVRRSRSLDEAAQAELLRGLDGSRDATLPGIRAKVNAGQVLKAKDFTNDRQPRDVLRETRDVLRDDQHGKCCYCERYPGQEHLEHFRPKARVRHELGRPMTHGYFWLAWTWDNLLFACGACNLRKSTRFPLTLGCEPLQPEEAPPGREHPLLIDPADHSRDPFEHICFRLVEEGGRMRWKPFPRNGSIHGATTIRVLGLDGQGLLEHYNRHVTLMVEPAVRDIDEAVARARATGDLTRLQQRWQARLDWLLDPEQPLIGLSCDALAHFYSRMFRRRWRLDSPRPVHPGPSTSL